jgi:hypothetical protein
MFKQRALPEDDPNEYVCWDYHVIVMRTQQNSTTATATTTQILDIDTWIRPYPTPLSQYLDESFPHAPDPTFNKQYLPLFHVIQAEDFIREFYSDRSHMFKNGKWSSPPPDYPPIMMLECAKLKHRVSAFSTFKLTKETQSHNSIN